MREATIILTSQDKHGNVLPDRVRHRFLEWIADVFGGYTTVEGNGAYRHPNGVKQVEPVTIVTICADPGAAANSSKLFEIAETFTRDANQECTYVRNFDGYVEFV